MLHLTKQWQIPTQTYTALHQPNTFDKACMSKLPWRTSDVTHTFPTCPDQSGDIKGKGSKAEINTLSSNEDISEW